MNDRLLYLCGGLQSSGSTLVSWCFLQRSDMNGILDARFDALPELPQAQSAERVWCKFTIACFRFSEVRKHFEDDGWTVRPLLVARDVRAVFNSLIRKPWGRNGITADDPPLRLRMRRFREDWQMFRQNGWPILRYEDLVNDGLGVLRIACEGLELPWDEAMATWPKPADQIADPKFGNPTFVDSRSQGLIASLKPSLASIATQNIPSEDLKWLEEEFAEMNQALGYATHIPAATDSLAPPSRAIPRFENTRRFERLQRKHRISRFFREVGQKLNWMSR